MLLTAAVALVVLLSSGVPAASAHDEVVAAVPAPGSVVTTPPDRVELEVSGPPQALGTQVLVTGPDGTPVSQGPVELRGTTVVQPLVADLPAGTYTVEWRVTSADGHPLTGTSAFTVAQGAAAAPVEPVPAPDVGDAAAARDAGTSAPTAALAVGAGLLAAAGGLVAVRRRRSRS